MRNKGSGANSLWRTQDPKYSLYASDGGGRDTFVSFYNGGFLKSNCNVFPITGTHIAEHKQNHTYKSPQSKAPASHHYLADGTGRDYYILANHGGFIQKYQDTGDISGNYSRMVRNYDKIILKSDTNNSPIMSPRNYMKINSPSKDGGLNQSFLTPRKTFEKNALNNGMNPWYSEKERKMEGYASVLQGKAADRLSMPRRVQAKWDDQVTGVRNILNASGNKALHKSHDFSAQQKQQPTRKSGVEVNRHLQPRLKTEMAHAPAPGGRQIQTPKIQQSEGALIRPYNQTPLDQKRYLVTTNAHNRGQVELAQDILARIQEATKSAKAQATVQDLERQDAGRALPSVDKQKIQDAKERRTLYNLAKKTGSNHRNVFNKTQRIFGLKGDSNWMCPGSLGAAGETPPNEALQLSPRNRLCI